MRTIYLRRPDREVIDALRARQAKLDLTYDAVGSTETEPPPGWPTNHHRLCVGRGPESFERAVAHVSQWRMFDLGWTDLQPRPAPPSVDDVVVVLGRSLGLWVLNACRVCFEVDETRDGMRRWGFGYGTLPAHLARGEERFLVEWSDAALGGDDRVYFDILSFSKPNHALVRPISPGLPWMRRQQRRFGREAVRRVAELC